MTTPYHARYLCFNSMSVRIVDLSSKWQCGDTRRLFLLSGNGRFKFDGLRKTEFEEIDNAYQQAYSEWPELLRKQADLQVRIEELAERLRPIEEYLKGGYFEMQLPNALLKNNPKSIKLNWNDFYR